MGNEDVFVKWIEREQRELSDMYKDLKQVKNPAIIKSIKNIIEDKKQFINKLQRVLYIVTL